MPEILVVAAQAPELAGLPPEVRRAPLGVGAVDAAAGMAAVISIGAPAGVVIVGTCGAFSTALQIHDLVCVERAVWPSTAPHVEVPEAIVTRADADPALSERLVVATGARRVTAACGMGVTVDDLEAGKTAAAARAHVEHMECFAVYRACARARIPVTSILAVANRVGGGARSEWQANASVAEAKAIGALVKALPSLLAS
jgi:purine-nucleoside phosphorylase